MEGSVGVMEKCVLTDMELRAHWNRTRERVYCVKAGTMLTPAAQDFVREHAIELVFDTAPASGQKMTTVSIPTRSGRTRYIDAATRAELMEKPEEMTHLRGNLLVPRRIHKLPSVGGWTP